MKTKILSLFKWNILISLLFAILATSCIDSRLPVSGNNVMPADQPNESFTDLTELMRTIPRIKVTGSRDLASVTVSPNTPGNLPLFVVDGIEMGYDYGHIYHFVGGDHIRRVNALSTPDAFSRYGSRAEYGAILIETSSN